MLITLHGSENTENSIHAYDFTNSIKSGLLLKPESRIALISSTLERIASLIITEGTNNNIQIELDNDDNGFRDILIPPGTYTTHTLAAAVQLALNNVYGNLGYVFNVTYNNASKHFHIRWNEGKHTATSGDVHYTLADLPITSSETDDGTKLSLDITATAGEQFKTVSQNSFPNYHNFPFTPTQHNGGLFIQAQVNFPTDEGETFIGFSPFDTLNSISYQRSVFPIPQHLALGYCGLHIDRDGDVYAYESTRVPIFRDYQVGNATDATQTDGWQNHTYPAKTPAGGFFTFKEYTGANGWDYTVEKRVGAAAPTFEYIKRVGENNLLMASSDIGPANANYDFSGVLEIDGLTILWSQPDGTPQSYWITTKECPLSSGVCKNISPVDITQNTVVKPGSYVGMSFGSEGYVKYWHSSNGNKWEEIVMISSSRPTTQEIFGDGNGVYPYVMFIAPVTPDATNNNLDKILGSVAMGMTELPIDFSTATTNHDNVTFTKATSSTPNKATSTEALSYVMKNVDATNNKEIIPHHSYGEMMMDVKKADIGTVAARVGIVKEVRALELEATPAAVNGAADLTVQWHIMTTVARPRVNNVAVGQNVPFNQTDDYRFYINFNLDGGVSFSHATSADNYATRINNGGLSTFNTENQALYPCCFFISDEGSVENITISQEVRSSNTGVVHFKPDTMKNVLGFSAEEYKTDNGHDGFESNKNITNATTFTCGSPNIHIQLMNLPLLSCNGQTKRTEKTLAVVPRYETDASNDDGDSLLHYQPNTYLYSPLHNSQPIAMNQIDVRLTNTDGSLATDLVCADLVLDIQPHLY
jgi:hypothetical protein